MLPRRSAIAGGPESLTHKQTREHDQRQREPGTVLCIAIQTRARHEHRHDFRARVCFCGAHGLADAGFVLLAQNELTSHHWHLRRRNHRRRR